VQATPERGLDLRDLRELGGAAEAVRCCLRG